MGFLVDRKPCRTLRQGIHRSTWNAHQYLKRVFAKIGEVSNMSFKANVLKVMIASPEEVAEERKIVTGAIYRWNDANASVRKLVLLPIKWETQSTPQLGVPAHTVINRQLLDDADLVIGIFGTSTGTPTEEYVGGTVEEIKKHVAAGKAAKIYFSEAPASQRRVDPNQYSQVQRFREDLNGSGLYAVYENMQQFRDSFEHNLALELNHPRYRWLDAPERTATASQSTVPQATAPQATVSQARVSQPRAPVVDGFQKNHVDDLLRSVGCVQRDLLRYLLQKGGVARGDVVARARTIKGALEMNSLCGPLEQVSLLTRTADQRNGYSMLAVNDRMMETLRSSLIPRDEDDPPYFEGV